MKVQVLMSTYNGERYVEEQIRSVLNQQKVEVSLLIRDDGSMDRTCKIIDEYAMNHSNIRFIKGKNIGVQKSFFELMKQADQSYEYFAFSDQDDVWLPDKLSRAIIRMQNIDNKEQPLLYAGRVIYANEDFSVREKVLYKISREPSFGNALVENICIGCTQVFNRELLKLVIRHTPKSKILHDWWLYLSASCFGKVILDQDAFIMYRQHENNQVGMKNTWSLRWKKRFQNWKNLVHSLSVQAQDFIRAYGKGYENYSLAESVAYYQTGFWKRISLITNRRIYRQNTVDNIVYKVLFFFKFL